LCCMRNLKLRINANSRAIHSKFEELSALKNLVEFHEQKREYKIRLIYPVRETNRMTYEFTHVATDCLSSKKTNVRSTARRFQGQCVLPRDFVPKAMTPHGK
jgi:hypothetical protein